MARLSQDRGAARRPAVQRTLLLLLVLIGILFGGIVAPAVAHESNVDLVHAGEVLDLHDTVEGSPDDQSNKAPDTPGEPASHHHCTIALEVSAFAAASDAPLREALLLPSLCRSMTSRAQAPPTEPPAA